VAEESVVIRITGKYIDQVSAGIDKTISGLKSVAKYGAAFAGVLAGVGTAAVIMATDLNASMANVATLIPNATERVEELKHEVQDLSIETGKSTEDLAEGLYQVVSAFGDTADSAKILETAAKGATAGVATTTDAINLLSAVTKGYGDTSAEAAQKASDLAFTTVKLGQTTFPELAASIGKVVPLASQLKVSQEELFATFATLTGVTGGAAEVSTQYSAVLRAMIQPTEAMMIAVEKLGYESAASMVKQLGMAEAMRQVMASTDGSEEAVGKLFGSAEALTAVFALTGGQAEVFNQKLAAMQQAAGATDEAFNEQANGVNKLGFMWEQLKAKFTVVMQNIGDALIPILIQLGEQLMPIIDQVVTWSTESDQLTTMLQTVADGVADLIPFIASFITGTGDASAEMSNLQAIIEGVIWWLKKTGETYTWLVDVSAKAIEYIVYGPDKLARAWDTAILQIRAWWTDFCSWIEGLWDRTAGVLIEKAEDLWSWLNPFASHSPSAVALFSSGIAQMRADYDSLYAHVAQRPLFHGSSRGHDSGRVPSATTTTSKSFAITVNPSGRGYQRADSMRSARDIANEISRLERSGVFA